MKSEFCAICGFTHRRLIVSYRRFGTTYRSHLQQTSSFCLAAWPLMVGPIGCSETSVRNYQSAMRGIRKERRTRSHGGRSLQWRFAFCPCVTAAEQRDVSQIWYSGILLTLVGTFRFLIKLDKTNGHYLKNFLRFVCSSLTIRSIFIETQKKSFGAGFRERLTLRIYVVQYLSCRSQ